MLWEKKIKPKNPKTKKQTKKTGKSTERSIFQALEFKLFECESSMLFSVLNEVEICIINPK